jgi:TolB-like protein
MSWAPFAARSYNPSFPDIIMTRHLSATLLTSASLTLPAIATAQRAGADSRPGVAVLPFSPGVSIGTERETLDALSVGLQQILITELSQNPAVRVVDRSVIRDLMKEQDLGASGRVDAATAARVGKLVGARYVFTGGFNDINKQFRLDGRIVDVETGEIVKADQVTDKRDNMYGIVMDMAQKITKGLNLPPLGSEVRQTREVRRAELPREAVILYSQAQFFQDRGRTERAKELYERITKEFPRMTEAKEALRRIENPLR